jgi:hypothetical protein
MEHEPKTVQLHSEQWTVRYARMRTKWGECNLSDRIITIDPGTRKDHREREIAIHEAMHALFPYLDEEVIAAAAVDLDDFLETLEL